MNVLGEGTTSRPVAVRPARIMTSGRRTPTGPFTRNARPKSSPMTPLRSRPV